VISTASVSQVLFVYIVYYVSVVLQASLFVPDDRSPGTIKFPDISLSLCGTRTHVALLASC